MEHKESRITPEMWLRALRYWSLFVFLEIATLAAGIGVWMIFHGVFLAGLRIFLYWKPARHWFINRFKIQDERYALMPPMTWYRWIYLFIYFSLAFIFIFFGVKILAGGFLEQNIIYWFIR